MWEKTEFKDNAGVEILIGDWVRHKTGIAGIITLSGNKAVWKIPKTYTEHELTSEECKDLTVIYLDQRGKV